MADPLQRLLEVDGLSASYVTANSPVRIVRGLHFSIGPGEAVGLLGESGSGKTTTGLALLRLLPANAGLEGRVRFRGVDLLQAYEAALQTIRGAQISYIPQEPLLSLNPVIRAIDQVAEVLRAHTKLTLREARQRARTALERTGLGDERLHRSYPHELSGGQRQRVLIAQAIVCGPSLLIADEPTGSLDAATEHEILAMLRDLIKQLNMSLFLITHDPRVLRSIADRTMVMYAGRIVESGPTRDVLESPLHPYTEALLRCLMEPPADGSAARDRHVAAIEGASPDFDRLPPGCAFEPRCRRKIACCAEAEPDPAIAGSREASCFLYAQPR